MQLAHAMHRVHCGVGWRVILPVVILCWCSFAAVDSPAKITLSDVTNSDISYVNDMTCHAAVHGTSKPRPPQSLFVTVCNAL
jgi:hypothetical protein